MMQSNTGERCAYVIMLLSLDPVVCAGCPQGAFVSLARQVKRRLAQTCQRCQAQKGN